MERGQRIGLIVVAVVVAVVGFVVIQAGGDDDSEPTPTQSQEERPEEPTATVPGPKPGPETETITLAGGGVRGGEREIRVEKGDAVRIDVKSDAPDDMHLHGYDITKAVAPGRPARFRFEADLEGEFELEAHDLGQVTVATLVVEP